VIFIVAREYFRSAGHTVQGITWAAYLDGERVGGGYLPPDAVSGNHAARYRVNQAAVAAGLGDIAAAACEIVRVPVNRLRDA
jgi:hypothetical protein